jgi:CDP-paratose 2-epimerase
MILEVSARLPGHEPGLLAQQPPGGAHREVQAHEPRRLGERAARRVREESWDHFDDLESQTLARLYERPIRQRQMMVDEVPVRAADESNVWLQREQTATRSEDRTDLSKRRQKCCRIRQVLEEVAAEHDIDGTWRHMLGEVMAGREHLFRTWGQRSARERRNVQRDPSRATNVSQEFPEPRANVEDHVLGPDVSLEKVRAQHLPDGVLGCAVRLGKARSVERIEVQCRVARFLHPVGYHSVTVQLAVYLVHMRILITGGAGFVGSSLALMLKRDRTDVEVCAFDNLRRRGSELALARLKAGGIDFVHGDVRSPDDLAEAGAFDLLIECSAEPSVHAGYGGSPSYVVQTNLSGTINCLEAARQHRAEVIFLSTSRVYPIKALRGLPLERRGNRFDIPEAARGAGWSHHGIASDFPLAGYRSMYGATKLASELLIEEYRAMYGLRTIVNRCGVISGPWQMGKVDQGFVVLWASRHLFGGQLSYTGFGGEGLQVRDVLHVADLYDLMRIQMTDMSKHSGAVYNAGGGHDNSVSLAELTALCGARAGRTMPIDAHADTSDADVPYFISDNSAVTKATGWTPTRTFGTVLDDVFAWLVEQRAVLEPVFNASGARRATIGAPAHS